VPEGADSSTTYLLFVGGSFYANLAGIRWFTDHVAPHIPLKTFVVGRGLEGAAETLQRYGSVLVIGAADNLECWYVGAKAVIAPIFDGSGMKTKVAEALMFGKRVIGTSEAFSGYEEVASQAGWTCDTAAQWVSTLRSVASMSLPRFDPSLRLLYERHYSYEAVRARLSRILQPGDEESSSLP
jgi:glycosyltransferase involved in cell wall biosynthesis